MPSLFRLSPTLLTLATFGPALVAQQTPAPATDAAEATATPVAETAPAPAAAPNAVSVSQVRIVRLSQVNGKVLLDRKSEQGFEPAFTNLPIAQGSRLQSLEGLAEVEFEDNSSLRIAPNSQVDFVQLGRDASGGTTNRMVMQKGTLYISLEKTKGNDFEVRVADKTISLPPDSHIRLDVYPDGSELAVLHGKAVVADAASSSVWTVGTSKNLKFGGPADAAPALVADRMPGLYDEWDKNLASYHSTRMPSAYAGTPYQYGITDLNYYGAFSNIAGCGQVWQPYFTSANWNPFSSGVWAWYSGAGYSWVSPYPWGWTPFHSGNWVSCGGSGWGWQPGNSWTGLSNVTALRPVKGIVLHPPSAPVRGRSGLVVVGSGQLHVSRSADSQKFQFTKDSAGLGVPRALPVKLQKMSSEVSARGSATAKVEMPQIVAPRAASETSISAPRGANAPNSSMAAVHPTSRPVAPMPSGGGAMGSGRMSGGGYSPSGQGNSVSSMSSRSSVSSAPAAAPGGGKH